MIGGDKSGIMIMSCSAAGCCAPEFLPSTNTRVHATTCSERERGGNVLSQREGQLVPDPAWLFSLLLDYSLLLHHNPHPLPSPDNSTLTFFRCFNRPVAWSQIIIGINFALWLLILLLLSFKVKVYMSPVC